MREEIKKLIDNTNPENMLNSVFIFWLMIIKDNISAEEMTEIKTYIENLEN